MDKGDFLKKLKESLETGTENTDVNKLHFNILKQADEIKINPETKEVIRRDTHGKDADDLHENKRHAKALNDYLKTDAVGVSKTGDVVPIGEVKAEKKDQEDQNIKIRYEIQLLQNEITMLEASILKNKEFIEFLKTQIR